MILAFFIILLCCFSIVNGHANKELRMIQARKLLTRRYDEICKKRQNVIPENLMTISACVRYLGNLQDTPSMDIWLEKFTGCTAKELSLPPALQAKTRNEVYLKLASSYNLWKSARYQAESIALRTLHLFYDIPKSNDIVHKEKLLQLQKDSIKCSDISQNHGNLYSQYQATLQKVDLKSHLDATKNLKRSIRRLCMSTKRVETSENFVKQSTVQTYLSQVRGNRIFFPKSVRDLVKLVTESPDQHLMKKSFLKLQIAINEYSMEWYKLRFVVLEKVSQTQLDYKDATNQAIQKFKHHELLYKESREALQNYLAAKITKASQYLEAKYEEHSLEEKKAISVSISYLKGRVAKLMKEVSNAKSATNTITMRSAANYLVPSLKEMEKNRVPRASPYDAEQLSELPEKHPRSVLFMALASHFNKEKSLSYELRSIVLGKVFQRYKGNNSIKGLSEERLQRILESATEAAELFSFHEWRHKQYEEALRNHQLHLSTTNERTPETDSIINVDQHEISQEPKREKENSNNDLSEADLEKLYPPSLENLYQLENFQAGSLVLDNEEPETDVIEVEEQGEPSFLKLLQDSAEQNLDSRLLGLEKLQEHGSLDDGHHTNRIYQTDESAFSPSENLYSTHFCKTSNLEQSEFDMACSNVDSTFPKHEMIRNKRPQDLLEMNCRVDKRVRLPSGAEDHQMY